jgi:outer membrane protein assembly factor BamB
MNAQQADQFVNPLHEHPLAFCDRLTGWLCDGRKGPGGCHATYATYHGEKRYRCVEGCDFDLCEFCLKDLRQGGFQRPHGVAVDGEGNIFVGDTDTHRIQVFDRKGNFLRMWGSKGDGQGQFDCPRGVAVDKEGNVFVADTENNRIQVFDREGNFLRMWGTKGDEQGQFNWPYSVAVDAEGNVFVADTSNMRIQVFFCC